MPLTGNRTFVGFGFGAIQAGLFLYEAFQSGAFGRLVVAEVVPEMVATLRESGGYFSLNVAHADHIEHATVGPIQIENPHDDADREHLIDAIAQADEIATAVPSVNFYKSDGADSLHRILAAGLRKKLHTNGARAIIYAAENNNRAAEILQAHILEEIPVAEHDALLSKVAFLNTVIGKMSGVSPTSGKIQGHTLAHITPKSPRAFLVEAFNRILISKIRLPAFQRGIEVFEQKDDLLPFEEAKLYGHNATHALAAYLCLLRDVQYISELLQFPDMIALLRAAFIEESGAALIRKYAGSDPLFTETGYRQYADDLLERMTNPYLQDSVARVARDPARKLGWDDRLIGTMRLALRHGIEPRRYALGAAAALYEWRSDVLSEGSDVASLLTPLWGNVDAYEQRAVLAWVETGYQQLKQWMAGSSRVDLQACKLEYSIVSPK